MRERGRSKLTVEHGDDFGKVSDLSRIERDNAEESGSVGQDAGEFTELKLELMSASTICRRTDHCLRLPPQDGRKSARARSQA